MPQDKSVNASTGVDADNNDHQLARRQLLKALAGGSGLIGGYLVLPPTWSTPVLEFGLLPAHAAVSECESCGGESASFETSAVVRFDFDNYGSCSFNSEEGDKLNIRVNADRTELEIYTNPSSSTLSIIAYDIEKTGDPKTANGQFLARTSGGWVLQGFAGSPTFQVVVRDESDSDEKYNAVIKFMFDPTGPSVKLVEFGTAACIES